MKNYTIDHATTTIICTKKFYENASNPKSDECKECLELRKTFPGYTITTRDIKRNASKRTANKNLTYANMVRYIASQPNAADNLLEFAKIRNLSDQKGHYKAVKDWFVSHFPAYLVSIVSEQEMKEVERFTSMETAREMLNQFSNCETLDDVRDVISTHLDNSSKKVVPMVEKAS